MATHFDSLVRTQLADRRQKLEGAIGVSPDRSYLTGLLHEVDAALSRLNHGVFGLCETCHDPIEADRLAADPLVRFCIDHITPG
jgi:RNA polymerase-binding transcription factor DksA